MVDPRSQRHAIVTRDAAVARLRRLTVAVLAAATGIAGVLAGVAASSAHGRAVVHRSPPSTRPATVPAVPVPAATVPLAGALPPGAAQPGGVAPSPPVASSAPPIVVSGGS
jgi:hypothetical protein